MGKRRFYRREQEDVFQERLYCIQWVKKTPLNKKRLYEFREVTEDDENREKLVLNELSKNFADWQSKGYLPDMQIERGYNTDQPIRERGWRYWHHLFSPRQLLMLGLIKQEIVKHEESSAYLTLFF